MIRASGSYAIATNRPNFNQKDYDTCLFTLKEKVVEKTKMPFDMSKVSQYATTQGIMTIAKDFMSLVEKQYLAKEDPLPDGAKTYLEKVWLAEHVGLHSFSLKAEMPQIKKGNLLEDEAIELLNSFYNTTWKKNKLPMKKGFLAGTCDIKHETVIRDIKCPENWETFRDKTEIGLVYRWQLVSYCYLYDCTEAVIDYVLMPTPEVMIPTVTWKFTEEEMARFYETENAIKSMHPGSRIKTYDLYDDKYGGNLNSDIEFLLSRLTKAEDYYKSLTYKQCMKLP